MKVTQESVETKKQNMNNETENKSGQGCVTQGNAGRGVEGSDGYVQTTGCQSDVVARNILYHERLAAEARCAYYCAEEEEKRGDGEPARYEFVPFGELDEVERKKWMKVAMRVNSLMYSQMWLPLPATRIDKARVIVNRDWLMKHWCEATGFDYSGGSVLSYAIIEMGEHGNYRVDAVEHYNNRALGGETAGEMTAASRVCDVPRDKFMDHFEKMIGFRRPSTKRLVQAIIENEDNDVYSIIARYEDVSAESAE